MALRLVALALLIGWIVRSEYKKNFEYTPDNDPSSFYTQGSRKAHTLVCVGDSLTCGNASYNYVKDLSGALAPRDLDGRVRRRAARPGLEPPRSGVRPRQPALVRQG